MKIAIKKAVRQLTDQKKNQALQNSECMEKFNE